MKKIPTICQLFVAQALAPVHLKVSNVLLYHYMGDILIADSTPAEAARVKQLVIEAVEQKSLKVAKEKVQEEAPLKYLGWKILN